MTYLLPERLRQLRLARGWTQAQVSQRISITRPTLSQYEGGTRQPSYDVLIQLAKLYGTTTDYLLGVTNCLFIDVSGLTNSEIAVIRSMVDVLRQKK